MDRTPRSPCPTPRPVCATTTRTGARPHTRKTTPPAPTPAGGRRTMSGAADLDPEDAKIVTLARSARARAGAAEGAAVRDTDGRTYAGATVALPSLQLTALQVAVATAVSAAAAALEAAVIVGAGAAPILTRPGPP